MLLYSEELQYCQVEKSLPPFADAVELIVALFSRILSNSSFEGKNQSVYPPPVYALASPAA